MKGDQTPVEKALYAGLVVGCREFRLLNVVTTEDKSSISCTMRTVSLDQPEPFAALSYTWGDDTRCHIVAVNNLQIGLTDSLHAALKNMASIASPLNIWADAICINQWDDNERSGQVELMGEIYSKANGVLVWLGAEADKSARAVNLICEWGSKYHPDEGMDSALSRINDPFNSEAWEAVGKLFRRAWWSRLWTVQEVVLNKTVHMFAGKDNFEFKTFIRACMAWDSLDHIETANEGGRNEAAMINSAISVQDVAAKVTLWIERHLMGRDQASMASIVRYCTIFDVTDPRDRIYALLGMTGQVTGFVVDYTKTRAEVYTQFTKAMLEAGHLDILRNATYSSTSGPSWVPDWQRRDQSFFHADLNNASLGVSPICKFSYDLRILTVAALAYDTIVDVGPAGNLGYIVAAATMFWGQDYRGSMSVCEAVFRWSQADESNGKRLSRDLLDVRDLVEGFASDLAQNYPDDAMQSIRLQNLDSDALSTELVRTVYSSAEHVPAISQSLPGSDSSFSTYKRNKEALIGGQYFFMTHRGLLGRAAVEVNPGDVICVVLGLGVPMALRKVGQHFKIMGECFVLGLMDGEGVHDMRACKVQVEEIEIC